MSVVGSFGIVMLRLLVGVVLTPPPLPPPKKISASDVLFFSFWCDGSDNGRRIGRSAREKPKRLCVERITIITIIIIIIIISILCFPRSTKYPSSSRIEPRVCHYRNASPHIRGTPLPPPPFVVTSVVVSLRRVYIFIFPPPPPFNFFLLRFIISCFSGSHQCLLETYHTEKEGDREKDNNNNNSSSGGRRKEDTSKEKGAAIDIGSHRSIGMMGLRSLEVGRGPVVYDGGPPRGARGAVSRGPASLLPPSEAPQLLTRQSSQQDMQFQGVDHHAHNNNNNNNGGGGPPSRDQSSISQHLVRLSPTTSQHPSSSPQHGSLHLAELSTPHQQHQQHTPPRQQEEGSSPAVQLPAASGATHAQQPYYFPTSNRSNSPPPSSRAALTGQRLSLPLTSSARAGTGDIRASGMTIENALQRRQQRAAAAAAAGGAGGGAGNPNSRDTVKSLLGGTLLLDRTRAGIQQQQHGSGGLSNSRRAGGTAAASDTASSGGGAGPSTAMSSNPIFSGSFNGSFNASRGPGGGGVGQGRAGRGTNRNSPAGTSAGLLSGSFGARGGRHLMGSMRGLQQQAEVPPESFNSSNAMLNRGGGGRGVARGSPSPASSSSNPPGTGGGGRSSTNSSGASPGANNNNNGNSGAATSNSTPYDFRVVLSSGKSSTRPIELTVGSGSTQGLRPTMEDEHFCKLYTAMVRDQPVSFLGILDGHCGRRVAELGSKCLPSLFLAHKSLGENNALALVESIMQSDRAIYQTLTGKGSSRLGSSSGVHLGGMVINNTFSDNTPSGGSTLICAAIHGRMLYVGCLGDARAVLFDGKTTIAMSEDHKPGNPKESKRIQRCGGFVQFGRVCGVLAVSRALGDFEFKNSSPCGSGSRGGLGSRAGFNRSFGTGNNSRLHLTSSSAAADPELMVSNIADVRQLSLTDDSKFLILACDGLWDVMSNEEATQFVKDFLSYTPEVNDVLVLTGQRPRPSPAVIQRVLSNCSQKLAEFAVDRGSTDNVSVVLVFFHDVVETVLGFSEMPPSGTNSPGNSNTNVPPTPNARARPLQQQQNARKSPTKARAGRDGPNPPLVGSGGYVLPINARGGAGAGGHPVGARRGPTGAARGTPGGPSSGGAGWLPTSANFSGSFQRSNSSSNYANQLLQPFRKFQQQEPAPVVDKDRESEKGWVGKRFVYLFIYSFDVLCLSFPLHRLASRDVAAQHFTSISFGWVGVVLPRYDVASRWMQTLSVVEKESASYFDDDARHTQALALYLVAPIELNMIYLFSVSLMYPWRCATTCFKFIPSPLSPSIRRNYLVCIMKLHYRKINYESCEKRPRRSQLYLGYACYVLDEIVLICCSSLSLFDTYFPYLFVRSTALYYFIYYYFFKEQHAMLSDESLQKITLSAAFVHQHGDRPRFKHELNHLGETLLGSGGGGEANAAGASSPTPQQQQQQAKILNYFVRYRSSRDNKDLHRWSRIERVYDLAEWRAMQSGKQQQQQQPKSNNGATAPHPKDSMMWGGKRFFIGLKVAGEDRLVLLSRLSSKPPTQEEVKAFCVRESLEHPENVYKNKEAGILQAPAGSTDLCMAAYLPTAELVELLYRHKAVSMETRRWTEAELEEVRNRNAPYAAAAAAAAPVRRTTNDLHNRFFESAVLQHNPAAAEDLPHSPSSLDDLPVSTFLSQATDLAYSQSQDSNDNYNNPESDSQPARPPPLPFVLGHAPAASPELPSSPFLPKRRAYHRKRSLQPVAGSPLGTSAPSSPARESSVGSSSPILGGGGGSQLPPGFPPASQSAQPMAAPTGPRRPSTLLGDSGMTLSAQAAADMMLGSHPSSPDMLRQQITPEVIQQWETTRRNAESFSQYINDPQRRAYLQTAVRITEANRQENKKRRLLGMQNEKKLHRSGNLIESGGLWVTDDEVRAQKAVSYSNRASGAGGEDGAPKPSPGSGPGMAAAVPAAPDAAADGAGEGEEVEAEVLAFRSQRAATVLSLGDVSEEWMARLASVSNSRSTTKGTGTPPPLPASSLLLANRRLDPFRLLVDAGAGASRTAVASASASPSPARLPPETIRAQLIHRSSLVTAGVSAGPSPSSPSTSQHGATADKARKRSRDGNKNRKRVAGMALSVHLSSLDIPLEWGERARGGCCGYWAHTEREPRQLIARTDITLKWHAFFLIQHKAACCSNDKMNSRMSEREDREKKKNLKKKNEAKRNAQEVGVGTIEPRAAHSCVDGEMGVMDFFVYIHHIWMCGRQSFHNIPRFRVCRIPQLHEMGDRRYLEEKKFIQTEGEVIIRCAPNARSSFSSSTFTESSASENRETDCPPPMSLGSSGVPSPAPLSTTGSGAGNLLYAYKPAARYLLHGVRPSSPAAGGSQEPPPPPDREETEEFVLTSVKPVTGMAVDQQYLHLPGPATAARKDQTLEIKHEERESGPAGWPLPRCSRGQPHVWQRRDATWRQQCTLRAMEEAKAEAKTALEHSRSTAATAVEDKEEEEEELGQRFDLLRELANLEPKVQTVFGGLGALLRPTSATSTPSSPRTSTNNGSKRKKLCPYLPFFSITEEEYAQVGLGGAASPPPRPSQVGPLQGESSKPVGFCFDYAASCKLIKLYERFGNLLLVRDRWGFTDDTGDLPAAPGAAVPVPRVEDLMQHYQQLTFRVMRRRFELLEKAILSGSGSPQADPLTPAAAAATALTAGHHPASRRSDSSASTGVPAPFAATHAYDTAAGTTRIVGSRRRRHRDAARASSTAMGRHRHALLTCMARHPFLQPPMLLQPTTDSYLEAVAQVRGEGGALLGPAMNPDAAKAARQHLVAFLSQNPSALVVRTGSTHSSSSSKTPRAGAGAWAKEGEVVVDWSLVREKRAILRQLLSIESQADMAGSKAQQAFEAYHARVARLLRRAKRLWPPAPLSLSGSSLAAEAGEGGRDHTGTKDGDSSAPPPSQRIKRDGAAEPSGTSGVMMNSEREEVRHHRDPTSMLYNGPAQAPDGPAAEMLCRILRRAAALYVAEDQPASTAEEGRPVQAGSVEHSMRGETADNDEASASGPLLAPPPASLFSVAHLQLCLPESLEEQHDADNAAGTPKTIAGAGQQQQRGTSSGKAVVRPGPGRPKARGSTAAGPTQENSSDEDDEEEESNTDAAEQRTADSSKPPSGPSTAPATAAAAAGGRGRGRGRRRRGVGGSTAPQGAEERLTPLADLCVRAAEEIPQAVFLLEQMVQAGWLLPDPLPLCLPFPPLAVAKRTRVAPHSPSKEEEEEELKQVGHHRDPTIAKEKEGEEEGGDSTTSWMSPELLQRLKQVHASGQCNRVYSHLGEAVLLSLPAKVGVPLAFRQVEELLEKYLWEHPTALLSGDDVLVADRVREIRLLLLQTRTMQRAMQRWEGPVVDALEKLRNEMDETRAALEKERQRRQRKRERERAAAVDPVPPDGSSAL
eukprot:gene8970-6293_t